ncbi:MAG: hypothetical protein CSA75_03825, partial [Sorangium cellulosum]
HVHGTIEPLRIDSELNVNAQDFEVFDSAYDDSARKQVIGVQRATLRSRFVVHDEAVEFQDGRVDFGSTHLKVFTSLGYSNDFRLKVYEGSHVLLEDVSPLLEIPWKGNADVTTEITGVFNDPVIEGDIAIKEFAFGEMAFGDIQRGKVGFRSMIMDLIDVQAAKGSSVYNVPSMRLDFSGKAPVMVDALAVTNSLDVRDFLSILGFDKDPRFQEMHGVAKATASLHYELGGVRDRCGGGWLGVRASGNVSQLQLFEEQYDSGNFKLSYEWFDREAAELGTRIDVPSFVLRKGKGAIVGQAHVGPGGVLRARAAVSDLPVSELDSLGSLGDILDARISATADVRGTLDRIEADVDARIGPLRLGASMLPASHLSVQLSPIDAPVRVLGRTKCGNPITTGFDPIAYAQDRPLGLFEVQGELFGGQVIVDKMKVTRQKDKVVSGRVVARSLDIGKVFQLMPEVLGDEEIPQGVLSGALDIEGLNLNDFRTADLSLVLSAMELKSSQGAVRLRKGIAPITLSNDDLAIPGILLDFDSPTGISGTFLAGGKVHQLTGDQELNLYAQLLPTDLSFLTNIVPRIERANGVLNASIAITGTLNEPRYDGQIKLKQGALSLSGFPTPIDNINVLVEIGDRQVRLTKANARVGGGRVSATGIMPIDGLELGTANAIITARNLSLPVVDGIKMIVDADLNASWTARLMDQSDSVPRVVGDVRLIAFEYTRPFQLEADISTLAQRARPTTFELYDPSQDIVDFEVRVHAPRPLRVRNNLADLTLTLDSDALTFSGSNQRVGLRG